MKMSSLVKITIVTIILIGAHVLFGMTCKMVQGQYLTLIPPEKSSLNLVLWVIGSILLVALISGLVVALVGPFWIVMLGFGLSSLAMLLAWGPNLFSAIASLIYFLIAVWFGRTVVGEINNRLNFSVKPIQQEQKLLLFGLALMIGAGFTFGFQDAALQSGTIIPPSFKQKITDSITSSMQAQIEKQNNLGQVEDPTTLQDDPLGIDMLFAQTDTLLEPYAPYVPFIIGALLVCLLSTLLGFVDWLPSRLLGRILPVLKVIGVTHEVVETKETRRLVLD